MHGIGGTPRGAILRGFRNLSLGLGFAACVCTGLLSAAEPVPAPADLLPGTTVAYVEIHGVDQLTPWVQAHPLWKKFTELEPVQAAYRQDGAQKVFDLADKFEEKTGHSWSEAVGILTEGGAAFGVDIGTLGGVLLLKSNDPEAAAKIVAAFHESVVEITDEVGVKNPFETSRYRKHVAYKLKDSIHVQVGSYLIFSNKTETARRVVDSLLDGNEASLAREDLFRKAVAGKPKSATGWAFVRLDLLHSLGLTKKMMEKKSDNPLAELLAGGLRPLVGKAPYVTAALELPDSGPRVTVSLPLDAAAREAAQGFFFVPEGSGESGPALPAETIARFALRRDWSKFWLAADELFDDRITAEMAKADSTLSLFFSGKDFGTEVLPAVGPRLELIVARQKFAGPANRVPTLKFPSFALLLEADPKADLGTPFKVAFQSAVGLGNLNLSQQGRTPLLMDMEKKDGAEIIAARFLDPVRKQDVVPVEYNFSPTLILSEKHIILAATHQLATDLLAGTRKPTPRPAGENLQLEVYAAPLMASLRDNQETLIAQNMLEKGHDRPQAEAEIEILFEILGHLGKSGLALVQKPDRLDLEWTFSAAATR